VLAPRSGSTSGPVKERDRWLDCPA
jgi:hypothetical protein